MKKIIFGLILMLFVSCSNNNSTEIAETADKMAKSGKIEEAITYLEQNANKDSKNKAFYHARMGYYYIELNQFDKAEEILKQAVSEDGKLGFAYSELGYLYSSQNKVDLALENYLLGTKYDPNDGENFYGAGYAYYEKKDYTKAVEYFEKAIPKYKKEQKYDYIKDSYNLIAQIYYEQGNETKMNEVIEKAEKELSQMNKK